MTKENNEDMDKAIIDKMIDTKCMSCGQVSYIFGDHKRDIMFCTMKCMEEYGKTITSWY